MRQGSALDTSAGELTALPHIPIGAVDGAWRGLAAPSPRPCCPFPRIPLLLSTWGPRAAACGP